MNFARDPLPADPRLQERFRDEAGLVRASAYRMDLWKNCPSAFLFRYGWGLEEPSLEASWEDPLNKGILRHQLCQRMFGRFGDDPYPEDPAEIREAALEAAEQVFRLWDRREPFGRTPFWAVVRRGVAAEMELLLRKEAAQFPGYAVQELEGNIGSHGPRKGWPIRGTSTG